MTFVCAVLVVVAWLPIAGLVALFPVGFLALRWRKRAFAAEMKASQLDNDLWKIERDERMGQFEPPGSYGVCWVDYVPVRGQRRRKCTLAIDHAGDHGDAKVES